MIMYNNLYPYYNNYSNYRYLYYQNDTKNDFSTKGITPKELQDINNETITVVDDTENIQGKKLEDFKENNSTDEKKTNIKIGPIEYNDRTISFLNFSFEIDDLIIIGLILLLLLDGNRNYMVIIVLGLLLFNIKIPSLGIFS